jgi:hypothetical protein
MLTIRELERLDSNPVTGPLCPNCGRPMHLTRITPRSGGLPEMRTYKCGECGVWANEAAETDRR